MKTLIETAKDLFRRGEVSCIIGYEAHQESRRLFPFIAKTEQDAERLAFNSFALNNLAAYLGVIRKSGTGKIGIVAKGCDVTAIFQIIAEKGFQREDILVIGMECSGIVADYFVPLSDDNKAGKCLNCSLQQPMFTDIVISAEQPRRIITPGKVA